MNLFFYEQLVGSPPPSPLASAIVAGRLHPRVFASRARAPFFTRNAPTTREALADSSSRLVYLANETAFAPRPERSNFQARI